MPADHRCYDNGNNTAWWMLSFSLEDDSLQGEFPITREQFLRLRDLFEYGDDLWFANSYPVRPELWPQVIQILSCPPPEPGLEYFIEGYSTI